MKKNLTTFISLQFESNSFIRYSAGRTSSRQKVSLPNEVQRRTQESRKANKSQSVANWSNCSSFARRAHYIRGCPKSLAFSNWMWGEMQSELGAPTEFLTACFFPPTHAARTCERGVFWCFYAAYVGLSALDAS